MQHTEHFVKHLKTVLSLKDYLDKNQDIQAIVELCQKALLDGNKIMFCGNGGSAADAQHLAAELVGHYKARRRPLAGLALSTDTSVLTAVGNDMGFIHVFSRQVEALSSPGDVLFALSTSGQSQNILNAIKATYGRKVTSIAITGEVDNVVARFSDYHIRIPSFDTAIIQECTILLGHTLINEIEKPFLNLDKPKTIELSESKRNENVSNLD